MSRRQLHWQILFHRPQWRLAILGISFLGALAGLAAPWCQKEFVDLLTQTRSPFHLPWFTTPLSWIGLAFLCMLASQGLSQLTNYLGIREALIQQNLIARQLYDKMLELRIDTMSRRSLGEIVSLYATDVPGATVLLDQTLPMGASMIFPLLLTPFALNAFFDLPLGTTIGLILFITFINTALAFRQSKFFYLFKQLAAERIGLVNEWVQNIRTLRILGWTAPFEATIFRKREVETDNRVRMVTNGQLMNSISTSVTFFLNIGALAVMILTSERQLSPGEMLALLWILGVFLTRPFRQMPWFFTFVFDAWTSLRRLQEFIDVENSQTIPPTKKEVIAQRKAGSGTSASDTVTAAPAPKITEKGRTGIAKSELALQVEGLRLEVNGQRLLKDLSFEVHRGEFLAIVGEVGSGKSLLLLSLLRETGAGFHCYHVHGEDALQMKDAELRSRFSFAPQEGFIMSSTLRDNVVFDYDATMEQDPGVLRSLEAAQFALGRERVDGGLDTEIGERGVNLSGGQRQRVSLARTHHEDAPIFLLDDCLSAIDIDTEEKIFHGLLDGDWKDRTRILVTHRLTILDKVDRILFLHEGRLIAEGSFDELSAASSEFREFTATVRRLAGEDTGTLIIKPTASPSGEGDHGAL